VRVAVEKPGAEPGFLEHRRNPLPALFRRQRRFVNKQWLANDAGNSHLRVQRTGRVLEHELHAAPRCFAPAAKICRKRIAAIDDATGVHWHKPKCCTHEARLAGAGLADDRHSLALADREVDVANRGYDLPTL